MQFEGQIPDLFVEIARKQYKDKVMAHRVLAKIGAAVVEQIDGHRRYCAWYNGKECDHECVTKEMGDGNG